MNLGGAVEAVGTVVAIWFARAMGHGLCMVGLTASSIQHPATTQAHQGKDRQRQYPSSKRPVR